MKKSNMWVMILGGLVIITLVILLEMQYNNAVDTCIASGQSEEVCREGLK